MPLVRSEGAGGSVKRRGETRRARDSSCFFVIAERRHGESSSNRLKEDTPVHRQASRALGSSAFPLSSCSRPRDRRVLCARPTFLRTERERRATNELVEMRRCAFFSFLDAAARGGARNKEMGFVVGQACSHSFFRQKKKSRTNSLSFRTENGGRL